MALSSDQVLTKCWGGEEYSQICFMLHHRDLQNIVTLTGAENKWS